MPEIEVVVQIDGHDLLAGRLWSHRRRGRESQTFTYAADYIARPEAYALDPSLPLVAQAHQTPDGRTTFGAFSDAAPDRWGRFRLGDGEAREQLTPIVRAVRRWADVARQHGLSSDAIQRMAPAFEHEQLERAMQLVD